MGDTMNLGHLYLSFEGRIGRKAYWLGWLLLVAVQIAILVAAWFSVGDAMTMPGTTVHDTGLLVFTAVSMWPHGALMAKRFHDRNRPTWWIALFIVPSLVLQVWGVLIGGDPLQAGPLFLILNVLLLIVCIWFIVELGFLRGTPGRNQYGPDPFAGTAAADAA
jgi:uncharacterized membrane protein YhaH (DUF805 family)